MLPHLSKYFLRLSFCEGLPKDLRQSERDQIQPLDGMLDGGMKEETSSKASLFASINFDCPISKEKLGLFFACCVW